MHTSAGTQSGCHGRGARFVVVGGGGVGERGRSARSVRQADLFKRESLQRRLGAGGLVCCEDLDGLLFV